jgi:hypothetical protein
MIERKKISARPPLVAIREKEEEFINEGMIGIVSQSGTSPMEVEYPWGKDGVRSDVIKMFNVRLNEPTFLKLKYLSEQKSKSMNSICVSLIQKFLDDELD